MIDIIKNIKKYSLVSIITSFIFGVLLIAFPDVCIQYTGLFIGISLIALGIFAIASYIAKQKSVLLVYLGALTVVFGIIVCVKYKQILSFIILVCGIGILASGVANLITSIRSIFSFRLVGGLSLFMSIATIVFGIIAVTNYSHLTNTIIMLIGVALIVFGATELVTYIEVMKLAKEVKKDVDAEIGRNVRIDTPADTDIEVDAEVEND
ncbi:MAG: HdeD family acid-resistance protein [Eubacterium sp.]